MRVCVQLSRKGLNISGELLVFALRKDLLSFARENNHVECNYTAKPLA